MVDGVLLQLLLVWTGAFVLFALQRVMRDAVRHAVKGGLTPYFCGAASIVCMWCGSVFISTQRAIVLHSGGSIASGLQWMGNTAFLLFVVSGWLACRVGLPVILWRGRAIAWTVYNIGAAALLLGEALN